MNSFLSSFVSKTGELSRMQYFGRSLILVVVNMVAAIGMGMNPFTFLVGMAIMLSTLYPSFFLIQQRVRHIGLNTGLAWVFLAAAFVPVVSTVAGFFLLLAPKGTFSNSK